MRRYTKLKEITVLRCVSIKGAMNLTVGLEYEMVGEKNGKYGISNNSSTQSYYDIQHFEWVSGPKPSNLELGKAIREKLTVKKIEPEIIIPKVQYCKRHFYTFPCKACVSQNVSDNQIHTG